MAAVEKVEGVDELLISILVRLPPKSVLKLRCVSKRWYDIFGHPFFLRAYSATKRDDRLLAFIRHGNILPITQTNDIKMRQIPIGCGGFLHSSNGLILCCNYRNFYLVNPLTRARVALPWPDFGLTQLGLTCEENTLKLAPSFKVVGIVINAAAATVEKTKLVIGTYSCETRKWTKSTLTAPEAFTPDFSFRHSFVFNGVFHWRACDSIIAVYDPKEDESYVQLIKEPPDFKYVDEFTLTRSSHDDVMWVGTYRLLQISLWKLPKNEHGSYRRSTTIPEEEWILVHTINPDSLVFKELPPSISYFRLEALIPGNPEVAVLSRDGRAFLYHSRRKTIELVPYCDTFVHGVQKSWRRPYMEPI